MTLAGIFTYLALWVGGSFLLLALWTAWCYRPTLRRRRSRP